MKKTLVSMVLGVALATSGAAFAAGEMGNMDMSSGATKSGAANSSMSHGEVKKIDMATSKITIKHGPLENLGMDGMTMAFKVKDPAMLSQVKVGDKIDFVAEEVNGALTVTKLQKQ